MRNIAEKLCIDALENYYKYGTTDFLNSFEDNIIFYAPTNNRMIVGKENVVKYFTEGSRKLKLNVGDLSARVIPMKADALIIATDYDLLAYYPDGKIIKFKQHTLVALHKRKDPDGLYRWKCPMIHISNVSEKSKVPKAEKIDLSQYDQDLIRSYLKERTTIKKIILTGEGSSTHYIPEDSIKYVEGGKGVQCYVHTDSEVFVTNHLMKEVLARLPDYYYRCHSSYIVNLRRVKSIGGYKIKLETGEEIPVPAKKYAQVKEDVLKWMTQGSI